MAAVGGWGPAACRRPPECVGPLRWLPQVLTGRLHFLITSLPDRWQTPVPSEQPQVPVGTFHRSQPLRGAKTFMGKCYFSITVCFPFKLSFAN